MSYPIGDVQFENPVPYTHWDPPKARGLYAILAHSITKWDVLYIGQSGDIEERFKDHNKEGCWIKEAKTISDLFVVIHLMPNSTEEERMALEKELTDLFTDGLPCDG